MVYITGDTHADIDIHKLTTTAFPDQLRMTKNDYVIILGDFGFVWDGGKSDTWWQNWLTKKNFTTLFIDGNHDNHELIWSYPEVEMFGDKVREITPSIFYLQRGHVYTIEEHTFLTIGGAESIDRIYRTEGVNWWATEKIEPVDVSDALINAEDKTETGYVDYVLTHCAPCFIENQISPYISHTSSSELLGDLAHMITGFGHWYFGHYHTENVYYDSEDCPYTCLYNSVERLC